MKNRADTKKHLRTLLDGLCIAGAVLAPFFLGIIFVMMILHNSAPVWYLVIHALLFAASLGADLVMAGHTHGFNIPHFFSTSLVNDMLSGLRKYGDMYAVTTSGTGAWGFHYKWPAESEVVCIRVHFDGTK